MQGHAWDAPSGHGAGDRVDDGEVSRTTEIRFDQFGNSQNQLFFPSNLRLAGCPKPLVIIVVAGTWGKMLGYL